MRLAVCNRTVVETNGRPVYHIDKTKQPLKSKSTRADKLMSKADPNLVEDLDVVSEDDYSEYA